MTEYKRIIIIDDDSVVVTICQFQIKKILPQIEVMSFTSPVSGLEFIRLEYANNSVKTLLLLDINMPALTGWDVLDELKKLESNLDRQMSIYMFSSSVSIVDKQRSSTHSMVIDFIEKPLSLDKVKEITGFNMAA